MEDNQWIQPRVQFLGRSLIERVIEEALDILENVGVWMEENDGLDYLGDAGARIDKSKHLAFIPKTIVENALKTIPSVFELFDRDGVKVADFGGENLFTSPLAGAIKVWDSESGRLRGATHLDSIEFIKVIDALDHVLLQTGAYAFEDVPAEIQTCFRNFLCFRHSVKPLRMSVESQVDKIETLIDMMVAIRGSEKALKDKPMALCTVASMSPLRWDAQKFAVMRQLAQKGVPVHIAVAPMLGTTAPINILGGITQVVAEFFSGMVMHQLAMPGAPLVFNTSILSMDMRIGALSFASIEANLGKAACAEIAKYLGVPSACFAAVGDAKRPDSQSGLEAATGMIMAALGSVNLFMGIGSLGAAEVGSLEKAVIDNEIAGLARRARQGIAVRGERLADDLFNEGLYDGKHFLLSPNTLRWFKDEYFFPGKILSRESVGAWQADGSLSAEHRAAEAVHKILTEHRSDLPDEGIDKDLQEIMRGHARKIGIDELPTLRS